MSERICHWCGGKAEKECSPCLESFPSRPEAHTMTADQRQAEMRTLEWCEVPFEMIHGRIEQLVGRPVWTHEIGLHWEGLITEARWEDR